MITPPPNPAAAEARAAMQAYNAELPHVEQGRCEVIIAEWHNEGERTFTVDEVQRWFKVALPLLQAARKGNDERR